MLYINIGKRPAFYQIHKHQTRALGLIKSLSWADWFCEIWIHDHQLQLQPQSHLAASFHPSFYFPFFPAIVSYFVYLPQTPRNPSPPCTPTLSRQKKKQKLFFRNKPGGIRKKFPYLQDIKSPVYLPSSWLLLSPSLLLQRGKQWSSHFGAVENKSD